MVAARLADEDSTLEDALTWAGRLGLNTRNAFRVNGTSRPSAGELRRPETTPVVVTRTGCLLHGSALWQPSRNGRKAAALLFAMGDA